MNFIQRWAAKAFNLQDGSNPSGVMDHCTPPASFPFDYWQKDMSVNDTGSNTTVEACVSTIAQTVSMLPIYHYKDDGEGGMVKVTTSAASRVLRKPNPFQTKSDFFLNFTRQLLLEGNGYGVVTRNKRYEIEYLYPQHKMQPYVSIDAKDVYYSVDKNELINLEGFIPSRDVLHTKMHTAGHPLVGITPLVAATLAVDTGNSIQGHENKFFENMARPSGVVSTDMTLTSEQTKALRERFDEQTKGLNTGGIPILTNGLKFQTMSMSAVDAEIIETYKMSKMDISSVFRVPMPLIGSMDNSTYNNVEALMKFWISSGLGFLLDHIEENLNDLFKLPPGEFINFDTDYLLRSDFKSRMDGLSNAVRGGLYTPNEARAKEGLKPKDNGDDIYMQAQMIKVGTTMDGQDSDEVIGDADNDTAKDLLKGYTNEV